MNDPTTEYSDEAEELAYREKLALANVDPNKLEQFVDWKLKPTIAKLEKDLIAAQPHHTNQASKIKHWLDILHIKRQPKTVKNYGRSRIAPKLIRKQVEWRYASLSEPFLTTKELFKLSPVTAEDKESSIQNGLVLNNQFNTKIKKRSFIDEYVRTAADEGTVIVRVGWESQEGMVTKEVPVYSYEPDESPEALQLHEELLTRAEQDPDGFIEQIPEELQIALKLSISTGKVVVPVESGKKYIEERGLVKNQPSLEVCSYTNVIVDPSCQGDLDKAGFLAYKFETSISDLKSAGLYKNLEHINTETVETLATFESSADNASVPGTLGKESFNFKDYPRKKFVATEYWGYRDIDGSGIAKPFVCTYVGQIIIRLEENPYPDKKIPFVIVPYSPIRKELYGEPDGVLLEDNQDIVGAVTRGMIDVMGRSANGQTGIRKDALDVTNRRKFNIGQDYEFNPTVSPRDAIYMHTHEEFPQSAVTMLNMQYTEAESLTGVKAFNNGITGDSLGNSVGGITKALDATAKREAAILGRLAAGIIEIGRKIISMNSAFLEEEEVVRITNEDFVTVRRDDLGGKFDIDIDISTAEADNHHIEKLTFVLQTAGSNIPQEIVQQIFAEITRLQKLPELSKKIAEYQPQPDPLVVRKQELELAELEAKIAKLHSEALENQLEAAESQAKIDKLKAETDLTNLDYVEQESGTKHVRDVDKIESQARSQGETKVLEAILDKTKENRTSV